MIWCDQFGFRFEHLNLLLLPTSSLLGDFWPHFCPGSQCLPSEIVSLAEKNPLHPQIQMCFRSFCIKSSAPLWKQLHKVDKGGWFSQPILIIVSWNLISLKPVWKNWHFQASKEEAKERIYGRSLFYTFFEEAEVLVGSLWVSRNRLVNQLEGFAELEESEMTNCSIILNPVFMVTILKCDKLW